MDPATVLTTIGTTLATNALTNAKAPAQAIDDIMELVGLGKLTHLADKKRAQRQLDLDKFVYEIANEMKNIKPDDFIEPKLSIIGPTLEASKYYIEEEDIRTMFAKILACSVDTTKSTILHDSFVEVVKQLSRNDTIIFKELTSYPSTNYFPVCKSQINNDNDLIIDKYFYDAYFLRGIIGDFTTFEQSIGLYNLERLGLISCDWAKTYSDPAYDYFDTYLEIQDLRTRYGNQIVTKQKGLLSVTTFGQAFFEVCLG